MNELINNQDKIKALSLIYPIVQDKEKINVLDCCLKMINSFYDYIYFIYSNNIIEYSIEKFKELLEIEKKA